MKTKNNILEQIIITESGHIFKIGDHVRIQCYPKRDKRYIYSGCGMIGDIKKIYRDFFTIYSGCGCTDIYNNDILVIREADKSENFDNTPYINDEEKEFWKTHWHTKNGIMEKTKDT